MDSIDFFFDSMGSMDPLESIDPEIINVIKGIHGIHDFHKVYRSQNNHKQSSRQRANVIKGGFHRRPAFIGFIGVHADIVCAYLCFLRFKNQSGDMPNPKKESTVVNNWCQVKAGLRQVMEPNDLPDFAKPRAAPPSARVTNLLKKWRLVDLRTIPVKTYLLENQIEDFCLEAIWFHMQAPETTADVKLFIMHGLILRIQSGTDSHSSDLKQIRWTNVFKHEYIVGVDDESFSLKVVPTKLVSSEPVEFLLNDIITSTLFAWWYNLFAPAMAAQNAKHVFVFPHVLPDRSFDFTQPFGYPVHKEACQNCADVLKLLITPEFRDHLGANSVRRGNAGTVMEQIRG